MPRSPISKAKINTKSKDRKKWFNLLWTNYYQPCNIETLKRKRGEGGRLQQTNSWLLSLLPWRKNPASRRSILSCGCGCGMHVFSSSGFLLKTSPWNSYTMLENPSQAISQPFTAIAYHMNYYTVFSKWLL